MKAWFGEHKSGIKIYAGYAAGVCIGYFAASKISDYKIGAGLGTLHCEGIIKFFDPSNGAEIGIKRACEIAKQMDK